MKYVVISRNARFVITEEERADFLERYEKSKTSLLRLRGQLIDRYGIEIFELPFYLKNENEKLRLKGLRRCKYCSAIVGLPDRCSCYDHKDSREDNEFLLDEPNKLLTTPPMNKN